MSQKNCEDWGFLASKTGADKALVACKTTYNFGCRLPSLSSAQ